MNPPHIIVVGSVNLDIVARAPSLPAPGETVTGAMLAFYPGGKGANQALAAKRLGADVSLIARVGRDENAKAAIALLKAGGVNLAQCYADDEAHTGVALIAVNPTGENQIVVASGANSELLASNVVLPPHDAVLCQMEVPPETVVEAARQCRGFFAINLAPALPVPDGVLDRADLIIVNEGEAAFYGDALHKAKARIAITYGARGAKLFQGGAMIAEATPPPITPVDTTGAGDCFSAALTLALLEGQQPDQSLRFACIAGAVATLTRGAQPSLPTRTQLAPFMDK